MFLKTKKSYNTTNILSNTSKSFSEHLLKVNEYKLMIKIFKLKCKKQIMN